MRKDSRNLLCRPSVKCPFVRLSRFCVGLFCLIRPRTRTCCPRIQLGGTWRDPKLRPRPTHRHRMALGTAVLSGRKPDASSYARFTPPLGQHYATSGADHFRRRLRPAPCSSRYGVEEVQHKLATFCIQSGSLLSIVRAGRSVVGHPVPGRS